MEAYAREAGILLLVLFVILMAAALIWRVTSGWDSGSVAPQTSALPGRDICVSWRRRRVVAVVLALFWGHMGAHKFYMGRLGWGIIYALLGWTFIPTLVSFCEMLSYLQCDESQWEYRYNLVLRP